MSEVQMINVSVRYQHQYPNNIQSKLDTDEILALSEVNACIEPGALTLITGASGSGKSTFLRLLNGLVPRLSNAVLEGKIKIAGMDTAKSELYEIGYFVASVFQHPRRQFFTSNVTQELAFSLENAGQDPKLIKIKIADAVKKAGIEELVGRELKELSGGELQRVACAVALATQAEILLFDEPSSNLSSAAIVQLRELISKIKLSGITTVIAEHRLYFLKDLVDKVIVLDKGRVSAVMSGKEFFNMSDAARQKIGLRTLKPPSIDQCVSTKLANSTKGLRLENLTFSYGKKQVLNIGELCFPRGQVVALTGPNGAGKTTLARVITGLAKPSKNCRISLDNKSISRRERLHISALVMQDVRRQLFGETVFQEVSLGLAKPENVDTSKLLSAMDLSELRKRHPLSLSGGQMQRLVVAAALAADSQVYLFDEPTSGVDLNHLRRISKQLRELADKGAVVIVISHDLEFINCCADQICYLNSYSKDNGNDIKLVKLVSKADI